MLIKKLNKYEKKQLLKYILFTGLVYLTVDIIVYFAGTKTAENLISLNSLFTLLFSAFGMGTFIWLLVNRILKKS